MDNETGNAVGPQPDPTAATWATEAEKRQLIDRRLHCIHMAIDTLSAGGAVADPKQVVRVARLYERVATK